MLLQRPLVWFSAPTCSSQPFLTSQAPSTHVLTYAYLQAKRSFAKSKISLNERKERRKGGVREMRSREFSNSENPQKQR